ncbi:MAG: magnesium transporter [Oscillospiraceae bacterium]|nr:magnesium transporter [Oscillospiraceae bacterium]
MMKDFSIYENMLDDKQYHELRSDLLEKNTADIAQLLEHIPVDKAVLIFRMLPKNMAAEVFADLFSDVKQSLIERLSDTEIHFIIEELFLDDAADFIEEMPATIAKKVLANAKPETREEINRLLKYPENSAGSIMTVEYVDLKREMTVRDSFERIRKTGTDKETLYTCYVTDSERRLEGIVTAKTLMLSERDDVIGDIMDDDGIIVAETLEDQEEVAFKFNKYDLLSIPVVDSERRLVGIITVDDIADVVQEEATEDFEKMAAMLPSEKPYLKTGVFRLFKNRIGWLLFLMISGMGTGLILQSFEHALVAVPLLVTFIPMLTDTGGNAGSQSSTLIIRGMAVAEISLHDFLKVAWKEIRVSFLAGVVLSMVAFLRVFLMNMNDPEVYIKGAVISLTLIFTVFIAKLCGCMLPMLAKKVKIDPAVMAAPLITTIVDASSLLVFFSIAKLLLNI